MSCNCVICKTNLAEFVEDLASKNYTYKEICEKINLEKNLKINRKTLIEHLKNVNLLSKEVPIKATKRVNLNTCLDFENVNFEVNKIESVIGYLQKIYLKIHLNSSECLLYEQEKYLSGNSDDIPDWVIKNFAVTNKIFADSCGMQTIINLNAAIKIVENSGYRVQ
jgi:hypothetical protein